MMRHPVCRRPADHPQVRAGRLFQSRQNTVPPRRGIPGFEDPLAPAIEDLQMIVCGASRKFQPEDIVDAVSVRREGVGEPDLRLAVFAGNPAGVRTDASFFIHHFNAVLAGL